jgi:SAM-dependent methyltransferase
MTIEKLLVCPSDRAELVEAPAGLKCSKCGKEFLAFQGIPSLLADGPSGADLRTQESFAFEWLAYTGMTPEEDRRTFLEEVQLDAVKLRDMLVLDGGCGMGRYARVAASLNAKVVAMDLGRALVRLKDLAGKGVELVQGDLLQPPFKEEAFDLVYSHGVIHHTPDARRAFLNLAKLVKPGGLLSVWVYGAPGSYSEFASNPLRPGREWLRSFMPAVFLIVWTREKISDAVRLITTRLPIRVLYALCYPLAWLGAIPALKYLTFSVHRDFNVRLIENFDWLSPPYQSHHTRSEMEGWCREAGLEPLKWLPHGVVPKIGVLARRPA